MRRQILCLKAICYGVTGGVAKYLASGENPLHIIAAKIGEKDQTVLCSLEKLMNVGLIEKKKCITDENKPLIHSFMGTVFEEMCRYYTLMKGIIYYSH